MGTKVLDHRLCKDTGEHEYWVSWKSDSSAPQCWLKESELGHEEEAAAKHYWQAKEDRKNGKTPKSKRKRVRSARKKSARKKKRAKVEESKSPEETPAKKIKVSHDLISPSPQNKDNTPSSPKKPIALFTPPPSPMAPRVSPMKDIPNSLNEVPFNESKVVGDINMEPISGDFGKPEKPAVTQAGESKVSSEINQESDASNKTESALANNKSSSQPGAQSEKDKKDSPDVTKNKSSPETSNLPTKPSDLDRENKLPKSLKANALPSISHSVFIETVIGKAPKGALPTPADTNLVVATVGIRPSLQLSPTTPRKPEHDPSESSQSVLQSAKAKELSKSMVSAHESSVRPPLSALNNNHNIGGFLGAPPPLERPDSAKAGFKYPLVGKKAHQKVHADAISITDAGSAAKTPQRFRVKDEPKSPPQQDNFFQFPRDPLMADVKPDIKPNIQLMVKNAGMSALLTPVKSEQGLQKSTPMTLRSMGKAVAYPELFSKESLETNKTLRRKRRREASRRHTAANPRLAARAAAAKKNAIVIDDGASTATVKGRRKGRKSARKAKTTAKKRRPSSRLSVAVKKEKTDALSFAEDESHMGFDNESSIAGMVGGQSVTDESEVLHSRPAKRRRTLPPVARSRNRKRAAPERSPRACTMRKKARVTKVEREEQRDSVRERAPLNFSITEEGAIDLTDDASETKEAASAAPSHAPEPAQGRTCSQVNGLSPLRPVLQRHVSSPSSVSRAEGELPHVAVPTSSMPETPQTAPIQNQAAAGVGLLDTPDVSRNLHNEFSVAESPAQNANANVQQRDGGISAQNRISIIMVPQSEEKGEQQDVHGTEGEDVHEEGVERNAEELSLTDEIDGTEQTQRHGLSLKEAFAQRGSSLLFSLSLSLMLMTVVDVFALSSSSGFRSSFVKLPRFSWQLCLVVSCSVQLAATIFLHTWLDRTNLSRTSRFTLVQNTLHIVYTFAALLSIAFVEPTAEAPKQSCKVPNNEAPLVAATFGCTLVSLVSNLRIKVPLQKRVRDFCRVFVCTLCLIRARRTTNSGPQLKGGDKKYFSFLPSDSQVLYALTLAFGVQAVLILWQVVSHTCSSVRRRSRDREQIEGALHTESEPRQNAASNSPQFITVLLSTLAAIATSTLSPTATIATDQKEATDSGKRDLKTSFAQTFDQNGPGKLIVSLISCVLVLAALACAVISCIRAVFTKNEAKRRRRIAALVLSLLVFAFAVIVMCVRVASDPVLCGVVAKALGSTQEVLTSLGKQSLVLLVLSDGLASGVGNSE